LGADDSQLVTISSCEFKVWDVSTGIEIIAGIARPTFSVMTPEGQVKECGITSDRKRIVCFAADLVDFRIQVFDVQTKLEVAPLQQLSNTIADVKVFKSRSGRIFLVLFDYGGNYCIQQHICINESISCITGTLNTICIGCDGGNVHFLIKN